MFQQSSHGRRLQSRVVTWKEEKGLLTWRREMSVFSCPLVSDDGDTPGNVRKGSVVCDWCLQLPTAAHTSAHPDTGLASDTLEVLTVPLLVLTVPLQEISYPLYD